MAASRNHKLSQNFLRSPKLALMLVGHTNIKKRDFTLDIGAGSGVFTYALSKKSARVVAIESDHQTSQKLRQNTKNLENVEIFEGSFLDFDQAQLPSNYKVCSNIPFHLSSPILKKLVSAHNPPSAIYLITQKQFARKLVAQDRHFTSILGAQIYPFYSAKIKKPLRKTDFTPPPAVDTVFIEIKRRETPHIAANKQASYKTMIENLFTNNDQFQKQVADTKLAKLKPSQLTGDEWLEIFSAQYGKIKR